MRERGPRKKKEGHERRRDECVHAWNRFGRQSSTLIRRLESQVVQTLAVPVADHRGCEP